jgi:hypothetical protein
MNVLRKQATTVTQTLPVTILLDHLFVRVILATLEMEDFVKVCWINEFVFATTCSVTEIPGADWHQYNLFYKSQSTPHNYHKQFIIIEYGYIPIINWIPALQCMQNVQVIASQEIIRHWALPFFSSWVIPLIIYSYRY